MVSVHCLAPRELRLARKRLALEALNVGVEVFRSGTEPRWVITASLPLEPPTVSQMATSI